MILNGEYLVESDQPVEAGLQATDELIEFIGSFAAALAKYKPGPVVDDLAGIKAALAAGESPRVQRALTPEERAYLLS